MKSRGKNVVTRKRRNEPSRQDKAPPSRGRPRSRQLGKRPEPSGPLDDSNSYYLRHSRLYAYEYSGLLPLVGRDFLQPACAAIRSMRRSNTEKSWAEYYVGPFDYLVLALAQYRRRAAVRDGRALNASQWQEFTAWFSKQLDKRGFTEDSRRQTRHVLNRLFDLFCARGAVPPGTELPNERRIARVGESKFTRKGWNQRAKAEPVASTALQFVAHGRLYAYDEFTDVGAEFLADWVDCLKGTRLSANRKTAPRAHQMTVDFLKFLGSEETSGRWADFFTQLRAGSHREISSQAWQRVLYAWREKQRYQLHKNGQGPRKITGVNKVVGEFARLWKQVANKGVVPHVLLACFPGGSASHLSTPRRSIAQVVRREQLESTEVEQLWKQFDKNEQSSAREYVAALAQELGAARVAAMTPTELARAVVDLNNSRLDSIRRCAEKEFLTWWNHWNIGQEALGASPYSERELVRLLDSPTRTAAERRASASSLLYSGEDMQRTGNCLKYVLATQNGVASGIHGRYHWMMLTFNDRYSFHAYLHPHKQATCALWLMLMVESAANCEVVREMPHSCLRKAAKEGTMRLSFGGKARAGMKMIQDVFTVAPQAGCQLSCIQAIQAYQAMSVRYRGLAAVEDKKLLLLHERRNLVKNPAERVMRNWFKELCERHEELSGLALLPSMIRTAALMKVFHSRPTRRMEAAKAQGDQASLATTHRYTGRHFPAQVVWEAQIIDFAQQWQALVIVTIDTAAQRLGISREQLGHLLSEAARTGLGVACLDAYRGVQPGTKAGEHCFRQDRCWDCKMRYLVGSVEHILDLILFNEHLEREHESNRDNANWLSKWRPWLVFTDVALSKMRVGETADAYLQAQRLLDERRAEYAPIPLV